MNCAHVTRVIYCFYMQRTTENRVILFHYDCTLHKLTNILVTLAKLFQYEFTRQIRVL